MKNKSIFFVILVFLLSINFISANESVNQNSTCSINESSCPECPEIDCNNFYWVENYIKNVSNNATPEALAFINILKNANYNLQNDLNVCEKDKEAYKSQAWGFGICLIFLIFFLVYFTVRTWAREKQKV